MFSAPHLIPPSALWVGNVIPNAPKQQGREVRNSPKATESGTRARLQAPALRHDSLSLSEMENG